VYPRRVSRGRRRTRGPARTVQRRTGVPPSRARRSSGLAGGEAVLIVRFRPALRPEVREVVRDRLRKQPDPGGLAVHAGVRSGEVPRVASTALQESELDGPFDGDERRFDDQRVVSVLEKRLGAVEQPTRLAELQECGVLDVQTVLDGIRRSVERRPYGVDERFDRRATHRRTPPCAGCSALPYRGR
jgi:hypothetical protein